MGYPHAILAEDVENGLCFTKDFLAKQKFLFEIVHRLNNHLMFEEYIQLGDHLITKEDHYEVNIFFLNIIFRNVKRVTVTFLKFRKFTIQHFIIIKIDLNF